VAPAVGNVGPSVVARHLAGVQAGPWSRVLAARAPLGVILALAAGLRLFRLNFGEYQWDDDGIWSLAVDAVTRHVLPAKGINSTLGTGNGPWQVYLMMPLAAVFRAPLAGMVLVALLNTLAVYVVYRFCREFFSERIGLLAALLFAVNSWDVEFSRHLAVQGMLIPFQVLFFWNAARWLARGRGVDLVLAFLWLAIASQTYLDGLLHLGSMALILALGWRQLRPKPLLIGGGLWAALSAYYLLAVIVPEWRFLAPSLNGPTIIDASSLQLAFVQALHSGFLRAAPNVETALAPVAGLEAGFVALEAAVYAAGIAFGAWRLVRLAREGKHDQARVLGLLFVWLLFPIAIYVRHQDILSWRHLVLTLPLPAIFSALLLDRLWPRLGAPVTGLLAGNSLAVAGVFFSVIPSCTTNNNYALPYQQTFDLAASAKQLANSAQARRVYVYGQPSLAPILTSILDRDGLNALWLDTGHAASLALPAAGSPPAAYITLDGSEPARTLEATGRPAQQQAIPCEGMTYRAYVPQPAALRRAVEPQLPAGLGVTAADGIALERIGVDRRLTPGQPLLVAVSWGWSGAERDRPPATLFAHLVDVSGRQVAGSDTPLALGSASGVEWLRLTLPGSLPAGAYSLELGLYDGHDQPLALADNGGKALGASLRWGPLVVAPAPGQPPAGITPASITFGDAIELTGWGWAGGQLTLRWQALARPAADYTVFVHALDGSGKVVAQADGQPLAGAFPTGVWRPGETVLDPHALSLPAGTWTVEVGLYELATERRLPGGPLEARLTVP
jgi:dolichyl-phosphate-mannose-protein mannosyltransferase